MAIRDGVGDDSGVLVIRVWNEPDAEQPFRARITYGDDVQGTVASAPTTDPEDVVQAVRRWLDRQSRVQRNP
jgi:hypothetical protein